MTPFFAVVDEGNPRKASDRARPAKRTMTMIGRLEPLARRRFLVSVPQPQRFNLPATVLLGGKGGSVASAQATAEAKMATMTSFIVQRGCELPREAKCDSLPLDGFLSSASPEGTVIGRQLPASEFVPPGPYSISVIMTLGITMTGRRMSMTHSTSRK
jgi:hypothetical protein